MRLSLLTSLVLLVALATGTAASPATSSGPLDVSGELNGAPYRIVVPEHWNGTVIQFAHGLIDKADHPGEVDDRTPRIGPSPTVIDALLARGYALAGSARKDNGYAVKEGLQDVVLLMNHFRELVGDPDLSLLYGSSLGTVIAFETAERNGAAFDGFLAQCGVGAGGERNVDAFGVVRLAYDVAFGMPTDWGTPADIRDDIDFETEVFPVLLPQLLDPLSVARLEFIRMVAGIPGRGVPVPPSLFPFGLIGSMFVATEIWAEVERRAGGPVVQNLDHAYALDAAEHAYLASLGLDAAPLVDRMNGQRFAAPAAPRSYIQRYATYGGHIKHPVLTMHTRLDQVIPVAHESAYAATVAAAGRTDLLLQTYTNGVGHCRFTPDQQLTALFELERWVKTGKRPDPAAFSASLGFLPDFVPPEWPQP